MIFAKLRQTLKRHYSLVPLLGVFTFGCSWATFFTIYTALSKTDVRWHKSSYFPPFERHGPNDKSRLYVVNQEYKPTEELEKLKAEIGPYKE